ncbi:hypothetical protein [Leucobacter manosquensis]|uniref:Sugar ABC transporter ATPase n=1 Tax=Leucobacter manosquensis TaxID=2810611 RepID=A0ABS5M5S4_9MICO|nr:hypothetical protein [Leucobacter manosquensis]MBS3182549.1 hypothetical protein [Leucobacter manosquensis]
MSTNLNDPGRADAEGAHLGAEGNGPLVDPDSPEQPLAQEHEEGTGLDSPVAPGVPDQQDPDAATESE